MIGRLRVTGTALVIAIALVAPVLADSTASPASADLVVNGCTVVSNPTPTHFTNCPNMAIGSLAGLNLSYANFAGSSFAGCDSSSCSASDLSGANLTGANLSGAVAADGTVVDQRPFPPAIEFAAINLTGATLTGANLANVTFAGANLTNANLTGANLTGDSFETTVSDFGVTIDTIDATLTGANFTGTIVVPPNQSVTATSQAGAVVSWPAPQSLPGAGASCNAVSGSTFPLFGTPVTCQVGAGATGTFAISVAPTTKYFTRVGLPSNGAILAGQQTLDAAAGDAPGVTKVVYELSGVR